MSRDGVVVVVTVIVVVVVVVVVVVIVVVVVVVAIVAIVVVIVVGQFNFIVCGLFVDFPLIDSSSKDNPGRLNKAETVCPCFSDCPGAEPRIFLVLLYFLSSSAIDPLPTSPLPYIGQCLVVCLVGLGSSPVVR